MIGARAVAEPVVVEAVPNLSEGRRLGVVAEIADAIGAVEGVSVLDQSSDPDHNRSVITVAGDPAALEAGSLELFRAALRLIDLNHHRGAHPRMGAVDVLPFVPISGITLEECATLARRVASRVAEELDLPVFLYAAAARAPVRRELSALRRGGFEGLDERLGVPQWKPDFGPSRPHPTAGASAIGARGPLIAYNVVLDTDRLEVARAIARTVRTSGGGLPALQAIGVPLAEGRVQVSMNLTDFRVTPVHRAFEAVCGEAARHGVAVWSSELVGLAPLEAWLGTAEHFLKLEPRGPGGVLEERLRLCAGDSS